RIDRVDHAKAEPPPLTLSRIPPAFGKESLTTGGNASGIVDGAAAVILTHLDKAGEQGLIPLAGIAGWAVVGVDPSIMGIGAAVAVKKVLEKKGLKMEEIDLFEINEAFGAQVVAVERELNLDRSKLNVNGGAIALGHPLGMSGTRLTFTLALELQRRQNRYGIAAACTGGGQGVAILLETATG
ncbi:MAG: thiolase family protein, partial [Syntrophales bacterium LBB04]|nr:thiolase family protein [Syntrophales bacterium LBB04]